MVVLFSLCKLKFCTLKFNLLNRIKAKLCVQAFVPTSARICDAIGWQCLLGAVTTA